MIAFALNYIPFIGPFVATLFPTLVAILVPIVGSGRRGFHLPQHHPVRGRQLYRAARLGAVLAMSPTVVLLAVFLWTFLWGLFGAFIGVPIVIAIITFCSYHPSARWVADLLGGRPENDPLAQS